jgi:glutaredoxin
MTFMTVSDAKIYGTKWCPDCRRSLKVFEKLQFPFEYIDIEENNSARQLVLAINHGCSSVPTIVFQDGSTLTEPDNSSLERKLLSYMNE